MNSDFRKSILLVEDMAIIAMAEANILKKYGFEVLIAYTGKEAVAVAIDNKDLDLVLMDIDLGRGMDGTEAAQLILQKREIPIVFLSNHTEKEIVEKTEKITSYGYVVKNSGETVLLASIKMAFKLFDAHTKRKESEKRLNLSLEGADIGLWDQDFATQQVFRSDKWFSMLGYESDHVSGTLDFWKSIIHPDDYEQSMAEAKKHEEGFTDVFKVEHRLRCKDGSYKWVLNWGKISDRDKEGKPLRALGIHLNIDERVKTEEALKQSEERLRFALEGNSDGIWDWNLKTGDVYFSPRYYTMLGYDPNEFTPSYQAWKELLHPEDVVQSEKIVLQSIDQLKPFSIEFRLKKKDRSYCWILARGKVAEKDSDEKALRISGSHTDINERKLAEESLRKNENKLQSIFKAAPIGIGVTSNRVLIELNERLCAMLGYRCEELIGKNARILYPTQEEYEYVGNVKYEQIAKHGTGTVETRWIKKDGTIINILLSSTPVNLQDLSGGVTFTAVDVTERREFEEALKVSLAKYKVLFESFPLGITISDEAGNIVESNKQAERLLGISTDEHNSRQIDSKEWRIINADGSPMQPEEYASVIALKENRLVENVQMGMLKENNETTWINVTAAPIPLEGYGVAIAYGDISKLKKHEEELIISEEKYRKFFEEDLSGVFVSTPQGKIKSCNQAYVRMMEYDSVEELLSSNAEEHYSNPQDRNDFLNLLREKRKLSDYEGSLVTKKGKKLHTLENIIGIFNKDNKLVEFWGYVNDITEKKNAEKALKNAADEKEALHKELLHRVKNSFNLIKSLIYLERDKITDVNANKILENLEMRIAALAQMYSILNASGVSEKINLGAYLKQVTDSLSVTYIEDYEKIKVLQSYDNIFTSPKNASSIGLIVNELVTNSLKYAFPESSRGTIKILLKHINGTANITVSDDGVGVPADFSIETAGGLGTQLVYMLTQQLNGSITINKEKGTSFTISFPVDE